MFKYTDELLAQVMEISTEAFFVEDLAGNVLHCNSAACKMNYFVPKSLSPASPRPGRI